MKIKANELLERMELVKKQIKMLDGLKPCVSDKDFTTLMIESDDAEAVQATLEEYEELLYALIASAEVNI